VPTFTNQNDMSFFRNNEFWYIGSLLSWPPETHYRCVDECNPGSSFPSVEGWKVNRKLGKLPVPVISYSPCPISHEEL